MVLSLLHEARYFPSSDQATHLTSLSCPSNVYRCLYSPSINIQIPIVASKLAEAKNLPSGENLTDLTVLVWTPSRVYFYVFSLIITVLSIEQTYLSSSLLIFHRHTSLSVPHVATKLPNGCLITIHWDTKYHVAHHTCPSCALIDNIYLINYFCIQ